MQPLPRPDNRLFLGVGGSGKTTLALAQSWEFPSVILCDPNGEEAHADGAVIAVTKAELVGYLQAGAGRICWRGFDHGEEEAFSWACRAAWAAGNTLVVWDETDLFTASLKAPEPAYRLWNMGRHRACRVFAIARSPYAIPRTLTRNLTRAAVFRTQEPRDLKYLEGLMGAEAAAVVPGLQPFTALDWTPFGWTVRKSPFTAENS